MKKLCFKSLIMLAMIVLCQHVQAQSFSAVAPSGQTLNYNIVSGYAVVTGSEDNCSHLVIPNTVSYNGITYTVTTIAGYAFDGHSEMEELTIPDSITTIEGYAFNGCINVHRLVFNAKEVNKFAGWCWRWCDSWDESAIPFSEFRLTSLTIGNNVQQIPAQMCSGQTNLTELTIPYSVKRMGPQAFKGCSGITTLNYNAVDMEIGRLYRPPYDSSPFEGCSITTLNIGNGVTHLRPHVFEGITSISNVTLPNTLEYLSGFCGCTALTNITIPNSVQTLGGGAFTKCTGLTTIVMPNSITSIENGRGTPGEEGGAFEGCYNITNVTLSDNLTKIGDRCFRWCKNITSIAIPDSVQSIGSSAFDGCTGLTSIHIPSSITTIGGSAFYGCTGLTSIHIPSSVTTIGGRAFYGCTGLTSIHIPSSVTTIDGSAFYGCTGLTSIYIPSSVTTIGDAAFSGCTSIDSIVFNSSVPPSLSGSSFQQIPLSADVKIPCGSLSMYQGAFYANGLYFTNISEDCGNNGGSDNGEGGVGSDTMIVHHNDSVYVYIRDTVYIQNPPIHDTIYLSQVVHDTICPEVNGVMPVTVSDIEVRVDGRQIIVSNTGDMPIKLYSYDGRMQYKQQTSQQQTIISVPSAGVYLLRIGNLPAQKVAVLR